MTFGCVYKQKTSLKAEDLPLMKQWKDVWQDLPSILKGGPQSVLSNEVTSEYTHNRADDWSEGSPFSAEICCTFLKESVVYFTSCFSKINTLLEDRSFISHFCALPIASSTLLYNCRCSINMLISCWGRVAGRRIRNKMFSS